MSWINFASQASVNFLTGVVLHRTTLAGDANVTTPRRARGRQICNASAPPGSILSPSASVSLVSKNTLRSPSLLPVLERNDSQALFVAGVAKTSKALPCMVAPSQSLASDATPPFLSDTRHQKPYTCSPRSRSRQDFGRLAETLGNFSPGLRTPQGSKKVAGGRGAHRRKAVPSPNDRPRRGRTPALPKTPGVSAG